MPKSGKRTDSELCFKVQVDANTLDFRVLDVKVLGAGRKKEFLKKIDALVSRIDKLENLPEPCAGDCWDCYARTEDGRKMMEVDSSGVEHLIDHVKEGYLHGSLLVNAFTWAGYTEKQATHHIRTPSMKGKVKSVLRNFLTANLGIA